MLSSIALFQFHKGTIKPVNHEELADTFYKFQFHKGTIKPCKFTADTYGIVIFQFHKGTIKPFQRDWNGTK